MTTMEQSSSFYIRSLTSKDGQLSIKIEKSIDGFSEIIFRDFETFTFFREYHIQEIFPDIQETNILSCIFGTGIYSLQTSIANFYSSEIPPSGARPNIFLISTADEQIEVLSFSLPELR